MPDAELWRLNADESHEAEWFIAPSIVYASFNGFGKALFWIALSLSFNLAALCSNVLFLKASRVVLAKVADLL